MRTSKSETASADHADLGFQTHPGEPGKRSLRDRPRDLRASRWRCAPRLGHQQTLQEGTKSAFIGKPTGDQSIKRSGWVGTVPAGQSLPRSPPDPGQTCGPKCGWLAPWVNGFSGAQPAGQVEATRCLGPAWNASGIQPAPARPDRGSCHEFALGSRDARLQLRPPSPEPAPGLLRDRFGRPHQWWASRRCGRHRRFG